MKPRWRRDGGRIENLLETSERVAWKAMTSTTLQFRKHPHTPAGCDGYLTRRQAAHALGFSSEFKIRQFEKEGALHSVRGPMRAAFYPRAEVLALRARLALSEPASTPRSDWTDADLIALLRNPIRAGQARTALDLVLETQISIERAERVCGFLAASETTPAQKPARPTSALAESAPAKSAAGHERRDARRVSRDLLIRDLRDPDPRVRKQAFDRLKETRAT